MSSTAADDDVEVVVRKLFSGAEVATVRVPSSSIIGQIKELLLENQGIPKGQQRLLLENRVLADEETLTDLGHPSEVSFVYLQWKTDDEKFAIGDLVQLHHDGNVVFDSLQGTSQEWIDDMDDMLGRTFQVKDVPQDGEVSLPNPIPGTTTLVTFPDSVIRKGEELAEGCIVRMNESSEVVKHCFASAGYRWDHLMDGMLGKEFPVLQMTSRGIIALPSPDGSQGGKWYFPVSVVERASADHEKVVLRNPGRCCTDQD